MLGRTTLLVKESFDMKLYTSCLTIFCFVQFVFLLLVAFACAKSKVPNNKTDPIESAILLVAERIAALGCLEFHRHHGQAVPHAPERGHLQHASNLPSATLNGILY